MSRILFIVILLIFIPIVHADDSNDEPLAEVEGGVSVTGLEKFQLKMPDILEIILRDRTTCTGVIKLCYGAAGMVEPMIGRYANKANECEKDNCIVIIDPKSVACIGGACAPNGAEFHFRYIENKDYFCPRLVSPEKIQNFTALAIPTGCEIVFKGAEIVIDEAKEKEKEEEEKRRAAATTKYVYIGVGVGIALLLLIGIIVIAVIFIRKRRAKIAANQPVKPSKDKKIKKQKDVATPRPSDDLTTSTVPVSLPAESTQSTTLQPQPAGQPPPGTVTPSALVESKLKVTTPPPPFKSESKEQVSKPIVEGSTIVKPPLPYPTQLQEFLEDAVDSLHRANLLVLQPTKVKGSTGGLHPFLFKLKKDFDLTTARKVHQTELDLITTSGAGKAFKLLNKMMKGARKQLVHHGISFTADYRPELYVLDEAMIVYLKNPNTPSFIVLYVFTLLYSNDFNMNDGIDQKLDRLSMAALFVVAMMVELPPYVRIAALTKFRYRMPQIYRLFLHENLLLMPYPVNLMPKLSSKKATKLMTIPQDVLVAEDKYFDQVIAAFAPPYFKKSLNLTESKKQSKRRTLKSNTDKILISGEKNRKSPEKTSKSTDIQSPEILSLKSGENASKSIQSNQSNASEAKKPAENKNSNKDNQKNNSEEESNSDEKSKSRGEESKTKESEV